MAWLETTDFITSRPFGRRTCTGNSQNSELPERLRGVPLRYCITCNGSIAYDYRQAWDLGGDAGRTFQPQPRNLHGTWMPAPRGVELSYAWKNYRFTGGPMITIWVLRGKRRWTELNHAYYTLGMPDRSGLRVPGPPGQSNELSLARELIPRLEHSSSMATSGISWHFLIGLCWARLEGAYIFDIIVITGIYLIYF